MTKQESRLDVECTCLLCGLWWSIIDLDGTVGKDIGSGYHLSNIKCPNCESRHIIDFDVLRVKSPWTRKEREKYLQYLRTEHKKDTHFPYPNTNK